MRTRNGGNPTSGPERMKFCQGQLSTVYKRERFWVAWSSFVNDISVKDRTSETGANQDSVQGGPPEETSGMVCKTLNKNRLQIVEPIRIRKCSGFTAISCNTKLAKYLTLPDIHSSASGFLTSSSWIFTSNVPCKCLVRRAVFPPEAHHGCPHALPPELKGSDVRGKEKQEDPVSGLWKYGDMACSVSENDRGGVGSSPKSYGVAKKVSRMNSGNRCVVLQVCKILKGRNWTPSTVDALQIFTGKLNGHCVNAILQQQADVNIALRFFYWAKTLPNFKHDVYSYTTMISSLGRIRNLETVRHLLWDMWREGCEPTVATYNTLILCYGKVRSLQEALRIFRHMQEVNCKPDKVTYSILIHLCVKAGSYHEAMSIYKNMLEAGVQPDTITYSTVIDSLGKSGHTSAARKLFNEMRDQGYAPNEFTYNSMIDLHAKARRPDLAIRYYREMQKAGFKLNEITYTTMMGVLISSGHFEEAENMFLDMQTAGIKPDAASFGLMVDMWGKAGSLDKACAWYARMLDAGLKPTLTVLSSLVNTHIALHMYDAARGYLESMLRSGVVPDLKVYTLLLRHCTMCQKQEHVDEVLNIMDSLGHCAHKFVYALLTARNQDRSNTRLRVEQFFDSLHTEGPGKQAFANALIEFLHKLESQTDPGFVLEIALEKGFYPSAIVQREEMGHWLIDLHCMSIGCALVALPRLLIMLWSRLTVSPSGKVYIVTGWGKRSRVTGSSAMKDGVHDLLRALNSPFSLDPKNMGQFVSYGHNFVQWISQPNVKHMLQLGKASL